MPAKAAGWHKFVSVCRNKFFMENENKQHLNNPSQMAGPHRDRQGIDKAPGEEEREGPVENFVAQTQKGKNQVDGDPDKKSDQPLDQQDINA